MILLYKTYPPEIASSQYHSLMINFFRVKLHNKASILLIISYFHKYFAKELQLNLHPCCQELVIILQVWDNTNTKSMQNFLSESNRCGTVYEVIKTSLLKIGMSNLTYVVLGYNLHIVATFYFWVCSLHV